MHENTAHGFQRHLLGKCKHSATGAERVTYASSLAIVISSYVCQLTGARLLGALSRKLML